MFNAYISSKIGPQGMGLLTLASGIYGFAITFACSGINLAVVRLVSISLTRKDGREKAIVRSAFIYCIIFSVIAGCTLFAFAEKIGCSLLHDQRIVKSIKIFSLSLPAISISSAINGYFCAVRRVFKNVISQVFEQTVRILLIYYLFAVLSDADLESLCTAFVLGGVISEIGGASVSALLYLIDRKKHLCAMEKRSFNPHRGEFYNICSVALPVAISAYARSALSTVEHLAVPWGLGRCGINYEASISSYGILHGMVIPLLLFPSAMLSSFSSLLVPELAEASAQGNHERIKRIASRVFSLSLLFSVGISGIFISFSHEIGLYLYSSEEAGEYIRLLAPLIPLMYLDGTVDAMLKGLGKQLYTMRVNISDSLISVLLILILLPKLGISGYVIVIFVTEMFNTSLSIIKLLNLTGVKTPIVKWILKPLVTIILSTLITRFLFDYNIISALFGIVCEGKGYVILEIGISAFLYLIISRLIGAVSKDDIEWGKTLVLPKKN